MPVAETGIEPLGNEGQNHNHMLVPGTDTDEFQLDHAFGIGFGNEELANLPPTTTPTPVPTKPSKPIVGIIFPPPEVRNIVDKTASFVARNGPDFETRIRQNEINNPKFNFLNSGDPYHAYYQHKVKEIQEGKPLVPQSIQDVTVKTPSVQLIDEAKKKKQSELLKQVELPFIPKEPPPEFEFIADPPSISAQDLDVVKLTAQFVARNGRQFLSTLMTREQRNYQFDFLRPQHSLFQYFTKLLEQYTKVLIPPKDIVKKLSSEERNKILEDVKYRGNWIRHQEVQRRKVEEEAEKERMAYASIDWHDFVVVETVDYQPFEQGQFPAPTTPQEVGARVLLQDRILQGQIPDKEANDEDHYPSVDDTQVQDMEEDSDSSSDEESAETKAIKKQGSMAPEPPKEDQVIIKKGYDPKQNKPQEKAPRAGPKPEEWTISPITGERIPVSKLQEHMRISLLDPRWKDQRDRQMNEKVNQESVYAAGYAVDETLKQFAERRSDIFGVGVEETPIGKKVGEEDRIPGLPWDPTAGLPPTHALSSLEDEKAEEAAKKESIGPSVISSGVTVSGAPQPPSNAPPPPLPQIPGVVRPVMPPQQPNPMLMQGMQRVPPLLGPPGYQHQYHPGGPPMPRPPLLPPGHGHGHGQPPMPPMQPPPLAKPMLQKPEDEPPAKKIKSLEDSLIPEGHFFAMHKSPVTFQVLCPAVPEKPEMNLNGQVLIVSLGLNEPVTAIKTKIQESIGLAPGKQKLSVEGLFYKDTNSLAYYNILEGATITLSLKERGGRKK